MRNVGTHTIDHLESPLIDGEEVVVSDKLNAPIRVSVGENTFGDLLITGDNLKFIDADNNFRAVADVGNNDVLKSIILSEITFDNLYNFGKSKLDSQSYHVDIESEDFETWEINVTYDTTIYNDATNIPYLKFIIGDSTAALDLFNKLTKYSEVGIPVKSRFYNDFTDSTTSYDRVIMKFYDNVSYDSENYNVDVQLDFTETLFLDSTEFVIEHADLITFDIVDTTSPTEYQSFPAHQHLLEQISDLDENTNNINGYTKLVDGNLKIDDTWTLWLKQSRINGTIFQKSQIDDIVESRIFKTTVTKTDFTDIVNYDSNLVILEDSTVWEYEYINISMFIGDDVLLKTVSNWYIEQDYDTTVVDTTIHETKYLVEKLYFKYDNILLGEDQTSIIDQILNLSYEWIDQTTIDDLSNKIYDINTTDSTIMIYNGYYDIDIIQPNPNTIPTSSITYYNLYKDDDGIIHITRPDVYVDVVGDKHISISRDGDMYLEYDTTVAMDLDFYQLNDFLNEWDFVDTFSNTDLLKRINMNRGRYKIEPSTELNKYTITLFSRNS